MSSSAVSSGQKTQRKPIRMKFTEEIENKPDRRTVIKSGSCRSVLQKTKRTYTRKNFESKSITVAASASILLESSNDQNTKNFSGKRAKNNLKNYTQSSENQLSADLNLDVFTADSDKENEENVYESHEKTDAARSSKRFDDDDDLENEETPFASRTLHDKRTIYQDRIAAKKRKLDECFKDINGFPRKIEKDICQISMGRKTQADEIKSNISTVIERLEKVCELQSINRQKLDKMIESFQKSQTQENEATQQVVTGIQQILNHFTLNMEKLEEKQKNVNKNHVEQWKSQLGNLQKKIFEESHDEEKRRSFSLGNYSIG